MLLKALYLKNFRNFEEEVIHFSPKINLIQGENAQGKTSLLEAIFLLSTGGSFRTTKYTDLISHDKPYFYLEARFVKNDIEECVKIYFDGNTKKVTYNETTYGNFSSILGNFPSVLIAPSDIHLIDGSPEKRRRFINIHESQIAPLYGYHLTRYSKALKQRNALLKDDHPKFIEVFEEEMSRSALFLMEKRSYFVQSIKDALAKYVSAISASHDHFAIQYRPSLPIDSSLEKLLAFYSDHRENDSLIGSTQSGPHRDDLYILQDTHKAKIFSSEGQKRTVLLALKLAEWYRLRQHADLTPLFCIDDYPMNLDKTRLSLLISELKNMGQVFITAPNTINLPEAEHFTINRGSLQSA